MTWMLVAAALVASQPRIVEKIDPVNDVRSALVVLEDRKTILAVGCLDATDRTTITVMVRFEQFVDRETSRLFSGGTAVEYRFDQRPHATERWSSQRYIVHGGGSSAMRFILAMKGSRQVYLRARRYDGGVVQVAYSYTDPSRLIDNVLGRCGYSTDGSRPLGDRRN